MVALKKCVECFCDLAHKTVDQLFKVSTLCLDDHQVQPEDLEIVGDLSGETCSQICVHMLVFGKNWKTRLTLDSKLRGKICHKVEASVRFSTRTSHEWPSSHIQLQIGFSRWESSNRLQTGLIPRRRFCRKSDGLNVNNKKSDDTSPYYDAHHICSKQFVSLFSDCDFFNQHEQTCRRIFRCICKRDTETSSLHRDDCEEIERQECRHGLSRSTSTRLQS